LSLFYTSKDEIQVITNEAPPYTLITIYILYMTEQVAMYISIKYKMCNS